MKHMKKAFALSGLLVLLTFASALGQSDRQTIIHIPFNFSVGEKAFPAGKYVIERNRIIPHGLCSEEDIEASRGRRSEAMARYYGTAKAPGAPAQPGRPAAKPQRSGLLGRLKRWLEL